MTFVLKLGKVDIDNELNLTFVLCLKIKVELHYLT